MWPPRRLFALEPSPVVDVGSPSRRRRRCRIGVCGGVPVLLLAFPSSLSWDLECLELKLCVGDMESLEELMDPWGEMVDCGLCELGIEVERVVFLNCTVHCPVSPYLAASPSNKK